MQAPESRKEILIIDGDHAGVDLLRQKLCEAGFSARACADESEALTLFGQRPPHLVIIDCSKPTFKALEVIAGVRSARADHPVRLMLLSTLSSEPDVVAGFDLGADDYICKPFSIRELVARVGAVLRPHGPATRGSKLSCSGLVLDPSVNRVTAHGRLLHLRATEYRILEFLMSHAGTAFSRVQLLAHIWGRESALNERTIDVNMQRLRRILSGSGCASHIQTVRGVGYRFDTSVIQPAE